MAVRVDPLQAVRAHDRRGNRASPLVTAAPGVYWPQAAASGRRWSDDLAGQADALPDRLGRVGDRRMGEHCDDPQRLEGVAHHGIDARAGLGLPRLVRLRGARSWRAPAARWRRAPCSAAPHPIGRRCRRRPPPQPRASGAVGIGCGADAVALLRDDRRHSGEEVAEVVGEVGVVARREAFDREVAVVAVGGVGEHVVAEPVEADIVDQVERVDHVARRLAHLLAARSAASRRSPSPSAGRRRPTSASPASTRSAGARCPCRSGGSRPATSRW